MRKILTFLFLSICIQSYSQDATFVFSGMNYKLDSATEASYNKLKFTVNGVVLAQQNKKFKIKIHKNGLDTIKLENYSVSPSETIIAKLQAGETYEIHFNACSNYEIIPATKRNGSKLVRFVSVNKNGAKMFLNSPYCFVEPQQIHDKDTTYYFYNASSGYCPYAVTPFQVCTKDFEDLYNNQYNPSDCPGNLILYFSGREMFTLFYDYKTNLLTAKFDGYYTNKLKVKIESMPE